MKKLFFICVLLALTINVYARCNMTNMDDNTRVVFLAKDFASQADHEFKQDHATRGCELLKISQSFIKQSDNQTLISDISSLYDEKCNIHS